MVFLERKVTGSSYQSYAPVEKLETGESRLTNGPVGFALNEDCRM